MKCSPLLLSVVFAAGTTILAIAGGNPDFERDAKPILSAQPGLVSYIHSHFVVKETGIARVPGTADHPPEPPFIFSARPRGDSGPFYLRLLIQPGEEGRILKVADIRRLPPGMSEPSSAPEAPAAAEAPAPSTSHPIGAAPTPSSTSTTEPSADTPSGPIRD